MGTFDGVTFQELGPEYPIWSKSGTTIVKKIPGSSNNVIQKIGVDLPRLSLQVKLTAAQLTSMYGKVGNSASLVFSYETTTARLESIDPPVSIGIDNDIYLATLSFIRSSGAITGASGSSVRITESSDTRLTESGDIRVLE